MADKSKTKKLEPLSWTPVRRGAAYCSPACGAGCTVREHRRAVRDADALVRRLRGSGWRPVVWENLGWHFRAVSGPVQVYGDRRGRGGRLRYSCMVADRLEENAGGSTIWTDPGRGHYADPNEAVDAEVRAAFEGAMRVGIAVREAARAAGKDKEFAWNGIVNTLFARKWG